jgi:hypothetical protein
LLFICNCWAPAYRFYFVKLLINPQTVCHFPWTCRSLDHRRCVSGLVSWLREETVLAQKYMGNWLMDC